MKIEEAIEKLKSKMDGHTDTSYEWAETVRMAIKALEQQLCDDSVKREDVKSGMIKYGFLAPDMTVTEFVEDLPFVTPKAEWIPVSEKLPEEIGTYMTTVDYGMYGLAAGQRYYHGKGLGWEDDCVIAWMPLPKPYKTESEDKNGNINNKE